MTTYTTFPSFSHFVASITFLAGSSVAVQQLWKDWHCFAIPPKNHITICPINNISLEGNTIRKPDIF